MESDPEKEDVEDVTIKDEMELLWRIFFKDNEVDIYMTRNNCYMLRDGMYT